MVHQPATELQQLSQSCQLEFSDRFELETAQKKKKKTATAELVWSATIGPFFDFYYTYGYVSDNKLSPNQSHLSWPILFLKYIPKKCLAAIPFHNNLFNASTENYYQIQQSIPFIPIYPTASDSRIQPNLAFLRKSQLTETLVKLNTVAAISQSNAYAYKTLINMPGGIQCSNPRWIYNRTQKNTEHPALI